MVGLKHIALESSIMKKKSNIDESFFKGNIDVFTLDEYSKLYDKKR